MKIPVFLSILLVGGFVILNSQCWMKPSPQKPIVTSNFKWERNFFDGINQATELAGIQPLRETPMSSSDLEIRVWRGFVVLPLEGVVINRIDSKWSAIHIDTNTYEKDPEFEVTELPEPKSGWAAFTGKLISTGILTLPDSSEIGCEIGQFDGIGYVVELQVNNRYRAYRYEDGGCDEAAKMKEISNYIGFEFNSGKEECDLVRWFACSTR